MSARFLISILTYRVESGVEKCLASVLGSGGNFGLHLTANGCPRVLSIFAQAKKCVTDCEIVVNESNEGFVSPNNRAMEYAQAKGYDYLVLLNDDAQVPYGWLDYIEAEFNRHPAAAIVGAKGNCRTLNADFHGYSGASLDYIEGSCAAYKVSVWKKHFKSLFPSFLTFCYGEDASASLEVRKLGYSIHEANFHIDHARGSTSKHVPQAKASQTKNHEIARVRYKHFLSTKTFNYRIIVRRWAAAGDVLLTTPILRKLWEQNPLCEICVETFFPELFDGNPCVSLAAKQIHRLPTDQVINLDMVSENSPMRHFVTSYAREAGVEVELPCKTEIYWTPKSELRLTKAKWVAVHAGSSTWVAKQYRAENWNPIISGLKELGYEVVVVGADVLPGVRGYDLNVSGQTKTLNELAGILSQCALFVGLDSAPFHVSSSVGIPTVGIFGITDSRYILTASNAVGVNADPMLYPRAGERHRIAGVTEIFEDGETINSIKPEQVLEAVEQLTAKSKIIA